MSVQVSYKKQSLLGIIGIFLLLLTIEIIANFWWASQINCEFEENEIFQTMSDDQKKQICFDLYDVKTSGNLLVPNQKSETLSINSLGFRGDEISESKPENTFRIFMLGGSTMFGHGATSDDTTIPGYIQNMLEEKSHNYEIQVINAGIQGADSFDEVNILETKILQLNPDLVIIYDGWNDLREQNSYQEISRNWEKICQIGNDNDFGVMISLQPIAGFGEKPLTNQEQEYVRTGTNYGDQQLTNFLVNYDKYENELELLDTCTLTVNLRGIFDSIDSPVYWDQGHVSDYGNSIVAQKMISYIQKILPENFDEGLESEVALENIENNLALQFQYMIAGYKTPVMINEMFSFKMPTQQSEELDDVEKMDDGRRSDFYTNSKQYNGDLIHIQFQILRDENAQDNKTLQIKTINQSTGEAIPHVTYFMTISKSDQLLLSDFFYSENQIMILDIETLDSELKIIGDRQYDHNAFIAGIEEPITIKGDIFRNYEEYTVKFELRTIYEKSNWVFSLDGLSVDLKI
ncbi:MAG: Uncharacterised protein [Candidatus Nitrosopelagicus brevis]|nr:MAG: Uncharacterised protein [Candidatus Nitrosopelagicus brevis]